MSASGLSPAQKEALRALKVELAAEAKAAAKEEARRAKEAKAAAKEAKKQREKDAKAGLKLSGDVTGAIRGKEGVSVGKGEGGKEEGASDADSEDEAGEEDGPAGVPLGEYSILDEDSQYAASAASNLLDSATGDAKRRQLLTQQVSVGERAVRAVGESAVLAALRWGHHSGRGCGGPPRVRCS